MKLTNANKCEPPNMGFTFRTANSQDIPFIARCTNNLLEMEQSTSANPLDLVDNVHTHILQWSKTIVSLVHISTLIAEKENTPIGVIIGTMEPHPNPFVKPCIRGTINVLWVEPAYRYQHIGRSLVSSIKELFSLESVSYIDVEHTYSNVKASNFWHNMGFTPNSLSRRLILR